MSTERVMHCALFSVGVCLHGWSCQETIDAALALGNILGGGPNNAQASGSVPCVLPDGRLNAWWLHYASFPSPLPFRFQPPPPFLPLPPPAPAPSVPPPPSQHILQRISPFSVSPHTLTPLLHPPPTPTALPSSVSRQVSFPLRRLGHSEHRHTPPTRSFN